MQATRGGRKFAASLHIIVANNNINEATIIGQQRASWPITAESRCIELYTRRSILHEKLYISVTSKCYIGSNIKAVSKSAQLFSRYINHRNRRFF